LTKLALLIYNSTFEIQIKRLKVDKVDTIDLLLNISKEKEIIYFVADLLAVLIYLIKLI
jgi:hypothetical protein